MGLLPRWLPRLLHLHYAVHLVLPSLCYLFARPSFPATSSLWAASIYVDRERTLALLVLVASCWAGVRSATPEDFLARFFFYQWSAVGLACIWGEQYLAVPLLLVLVLALHLGLPAPRFDGASRINTVNHVSLGDAVTRLEESRDATRGGCLVVLLTTTWAAPCHTLMPLFAALSEDFADVPWVKIDVTRGANGVADKYNVDVRPTSRALPALLLLKRADDGQVVVHKRIDGHRAMTRARIIASFELDFWQGRNKTIREATKGSEPVLQKSSKGVTMAPSKAKKKKRKDD